MKQKEKKYLIGFKLYIDNYDPRYRYPKWIKATGRTDAVNKYMAIVKPDLALGACIVMDEKPVKQDETVDETKTEHPENINDVYREGNLKLLEMMISQLNNSIDPINVDHAPRPNIIDMDEINEQLCSTSKLAYLLESGAGHDMLPDNGYIYTDDFLGNINEYMDTKYLYEFYNDYTLAKIRDDLQRIHDCYNNHGILPWQDNKEEDAKEMKENIVKGDRTNKKTPIDIIEYAPQFDISCEDIKPNFPYILEIENPVTGIAEKHVIVITQIMNNCFYSNQWDNINDDPHSGMVLSATEFHERKGVLRKITSEDLK